ncbi:MAG: helix-turn-helix transcriptional regulator [Bauldia sp.]|nr:helix-turn-helix transcriptional regulator [Bauldia sp.]
MAKRAESRDETRARIVDAAIALHEEVGPKDTTISAIAERAGVQRLTVYRHFPDDETLFQACSSGWMALHPPPDPEGVVGGGRKACEYGLAALFAYYSATQGMWTSVLRDAKQVAALRQPVDDYHQYLDRYAMALGRALSSAEDRAVALTLRHAVAFPTWVSLGERGLADGEKAALVMDWLACLSAPSSSVPSRGM